MNADRPKRMSLLAAIALPLAILGAGCNAESRATEPVPRHSVHSAKVGKAAAGSVHLSETDRLSLASAASACRVQDKHGFFEAFVASSAVRRKYSAPVIAYSVTQISPAYRVLRRDRIPVASYHDFPITMVDYYYTSAKPVRSGDKDEYVMMKEINQSQSNQLSVEWTRVHFDGQSEGGEDLGKAFTLDGKPYEPGGLNTDGQLLFEPDAGCWQLVADIRHQNAGN